MAPLPPDSTARFWLDYEVGDVRHTVQVRFMAPNTVADVMGSLNNLLIGLSPELYLLTVTGARAAADGSNIVLPVTWTGAATFGTDAPPGDAAANYFDFVGRSADGRRVRLAIFGARYVAFGATLYRTLFGQDPAVDAVLSILQIATGIYTSINGFQPVWHRYANTGVNAYWRNKIR